MRPGSNPPSSVTTLPFKCHFTRGIVVVGACGESRTVSMFSGAAGSRGVYPTRSPTVASGPVEVGMKVARANPVMPIAAGISARIAPSRRASNSHPTCTMVYPRLSRNPSPYSSGGAVPATCASNLPSATPRPRLTMSNSAMPLPLLASSGFRITRSADISIFPAAFFVALSRSVMTRFRLLAGSIAKYSFPTICSYGPVEPNDRPPATLRRVVISTRETSARTDAGRITVATKAARAACRSFIVRLLDSGKLCSRAVQKSTQVAGGSGQSAVGGGALNGCESRIDQIPVTVAEPTDRLDRQPSVRVGAAETPRPCADVPAGQRLLDALVERRLRSELAENDLAAHVE